MIVLLRHLLGWMVSAFRTREDIVLENLSLRQRLLTLHMPRPRHRWTALHKLFWVALRTCWSGWRKRLVLVTPRTVVNWHREGFHLYWTWVSRFRPVGGRKWVSKELRALIFRMVAENPTWGAPRIPGELLQLGFDVSERSVSRWIRRAAKDPDPVKRWLTFLRNHREAIAAMDFFTVPTLTFGFLYCFFVIGHDRRKILHFHVTRNPHALWVVQQLREAWAYTQPHRFLLFDRDAKFGAEVVSAVRDMGSEPTRTAFRCPCQNGVLNMAERVGFESASDMETKEFCGAAWPSKVLKRKEGRKEGRKGILSAPLLPLKNLKGIRCLNIASCWRRTRFRSRRSLRERKQRWHMPKTSLNMRNMARI